MKKRKRPESIASMKRRSKQYLIKARMHVEQAERLIDESFEILSLHNH